MLVKNAIKWGAQHHRFSICLGKLLISDEQIRVLFVRCREALCWFVAWIEWKSKRNNWWNRFEWNCNYWTNFEAKIYKFVCKAKYNPSFTFFRYSRLRYANWRKWWCWRYDIFKISYLLFQVALEKFTFRLCLFLSLGIIVL